jgi:glycosyltransferase involved in cell wall biosynthesis
MGVGNMNISVVMPVYNVQRYVAEAIESLLAQTLRDFEFIIIDDGSTDGTAAVLDHYVKLDGRIRLCRTKNAGVIAARSLGMMMAKGELMAVMDGDDRCDPRRLELQQEYLRQHEEVVVVGSGAAMIDEASAPLGTVTPPQQHEDIEALHLKGSDSIFHSAAMLRLEAVRRVGGYRPGIMPGEDFDLWLRLGEIGRLANLSEPLLVWRRRVTGLTFTHQERLQAMTKRILEDAWERRNLPGQPEVPTFNLMTKTDIMRRHGWVAFKNGYRGTAWKYGLKSVLAEPVNWDSWRLLACVIRG